MNAPTVLIIDDDKDLCSNFEDILKDNGYKTFLAYTCAEGLMLTHTLKPHVVLLDHRLPDCSGTELLSKIKQMNPDCFCVIITAYADIDSAVHAMEKGAFHYLRKPFNTSELLQLLEKIVAMIRLREKKENAEESLRDSEEKYRTLVNNLNVGVYRNTGGSHGHFIQVNPAMVRIFGYDSAEEFMKILVSDLYLDPENRKKYIEKIREKGFVKEEELRMKKKDGTPIWASLTASAEFDDKGDIKWIDGVVDDITERKQAEETLRESEKKFKELGDLLPQIVFEIDTKGNITFVNRNAFEAFGYTEDDFLKGLNALDLFVPEDRELILNNIQRRLSGEKLGGVEHTAVRKDGTKIPVIIDASPIISGNIPVGLRGIIIDITERKRMEEKLQEINRILLEERKIFIEGPAVIFKWENAEGWPVEYVSPNAKEVFGYSDEDFMQGKVSYAEIIFEDDIERVANEVSTYSRSGVHSFTHMPYRILRKDGKVSWLYDFTTILRNKEAHIAHYLGYVIDITAQKQAEIAIRTSEERYRALYEDNPSMYFTLDKEGTVLSVNQFGAEQLGYRVDELVGKSVLNVFHPDDKKAVVKNKAECLQRPREIFTWQLRKVRKDGSILWVREVARAVQKSDGEMLVFVTCEDITDRKQAEEEKANLEAQLKQAQKMESVGQLAGGIAHDFNNILTGIIGYGHLLKMKLKEEDPLRSYADHIIFLSDKASNLIKNLLVFSREQIINPRLVDINEIIKRIIHFLSRIIGEDILLQTMLSETDLIVMADTGQIEQVLMNLVTNARDAMPEGGLLNIETKVIDIDKKFIKEHGFGKEGKYTFISVTDTGTGMDEKTRAKIFEPFFTTKEVGKGTGLGLSMAYGIIKQHDGFINVYSELGKGTTFNIYLPLVKGEETEIIPEDMPSLVRGTETVLLAEDDTEVRLYTKTILEELGFTVIEAVDGEDAVNKFRENKDKVQLLLFDVIMRNKNGSEAYEEIRKISPDIKALFMSGYTKDIIRGRGILENGFEFLLKPASPTVLSRKVRELLDK